MTRLRVAVAAAALLAGGLAVPALGSSTAATSAAASYGCVLGEGEQPDPHQAHCGGYFPARDGTPLRWQVYLPDPAVWGPGPYPTVLDYSGYEPGTIFFDGLKNAFIRQGYAVAGVNVRGTGCSGGRFDYFEKAEWEDGYDAVEFLAKQPWSDGGIAMVGKSYPGITQAFVAAEQPPHLRAIVPGAYFADIYRDVAYPGGILNAAFASVWSLASRPANEFDQWSAGVQQGDQTCITSQAEHAQNPVTNPFVELASHPYDDELWQSRSPDNFAARIKVPVLAEVAWQDEELAARGIDLLPRLPRSTPWRAVVTNGDHGEYYDGWVLAEIFRFLSYYVKRQLPSGDACGPRAYVAALRCYQAEPRVVDGFENGPDRTPSWTQTFDSWPVTSQVQRLFLRSGGGLSGAAPAADEAGTTYRYTPVVGTSSYGNAHDLYDALPEHDWWQDRPPAGTTASFTTPPLPSDQMMVGTGSLDLWLSSTAPDTDVEVMVTELRPDGSGGWNEEYVSKGWLRASHRALDTRESTALRPYQTHALTDVAPLVPGEATPMRVEIFPFGHVFRAGTRLRITLEAPNTAPELWGFAALPTPAVNTIYTDAARPSSVALPLVQVPAGTVFPAERPCGQLRNQPCRPAEG